MADVGQGGTLKAAAMVLACLSRGDKSSLRWYWLSRCRCSVSLTTSLTACSIPRQHTCALSSGCKSGEAAVEKQDIVWSCVLAERSRCPIVSVTFQ